MRRDRLAARLLVAGLVAGWSVIVTSCATAQPQTLQIAPPTERTAVVILGGDRARGPGRGSGPYNTWAQQVFRSATVDHASYVNFGRPGFVAADVRSITVDLDRIRPTVAVAWVGDDDALRRTPIDGFRSSYGAMLDRLIAFDGSHVVVALLPAWADVGLTPEVLRPYNDAIRQLAAGRPGVDVVDLTTIDGAATGDQVALATAFAAALAPSG